MWMVRATCSIVGRSGAALGSNAAALPFFVEGRADRHGSLARTRSRDGGAFRSAERRTRFAATGKAK